jgi:DNA repair exonuclease SbcCD ATPase subunit
MKIRIMLLIAFAIAMSCGQKMEEAGSAPDTLAEANEANAAQAQIMATPNPDIYSDGKTKLIKTANYRFEVDQVKKSTEAIEEAVRKYPAYIAATELLLENPILENKMTIKVQSEYFYELLKEIDTQAKFVNFRNVKTTDVPKEFVDLESRLKTKREVEERYTQILRNKAGTIEELLDAERQIGNLHEEIEATISRINSLKDQVSYSSIHLEFYQTITQELQAEATWVDKILEGLNTGWSGILTILVAIAYLWPLIIFGIAAIFLVKYLRKRKTKPATSMNAL